MVNFKLKQKIVGILSLVIVLTAASSVTTFADAEARIYSRNTDASLYGWVEFLKGPLVLTDKLWYVASASGKDLLVAINRQAYPCYVQGGSNAKSLSRKYLDIDNKTVSAKGQSVGLTATSGYLKMRCIDTAEKKITTTN